VLTSRVAGENQCADFEWKFCAHLGQGFDQAFLCK
jgi:hypothetical protein